MVRSVVSARLRVSVLSLTRDGMSGGYVKYLDLMLPLLVRSADVQLIALSTTHPFILSPAIQSVTVKRIVRNGSRKLTDETSRALRSFAPDVVLIPTLRLVRGSEWPQVVMVRNMEPLAWFSPFDPPATNLANLARRVEGRSAAVAATRVIAVSKFVKSYLTDIWHLPASKVEVVYHGCDNAPTAERPTGAPADSFVFSAGSLRRARGLEDLLRASARHDLPQVYIAGSPDRHHQKYADRLRNRYRFPRVLWAGGLSRAQMTWAYERCGVFAMTSRIEACPNVALEAMRAGAIIVAANNPPLPEIFRDVALYYEPGNADNLAAAIRTAWSLPPDERAARSRAALARSEQFTWAAAAEKTLDVLASVATSHQARRVL